MKIVIGVIGCGHWGPNHIRNFSSIRDSKVKWACDKDSKRLENIRQLYPGVQTTDRLDDILNDDEVTATVVATPASTHYEIVKRCLERDKDVLCEKPLTRYVEEGEKLVRLAEAQKLVLMVGHVFLFNVGIRKLKEYIVNGDMGNMHYMNSVRTNLGPVRNDVNAVFDLASHDISIFNYLLDSEPLEVTARAKCYLQQDVEDVAFITLTYPDGILANIHVSWLSPRKIRQITVVGDKKMAIWDDLASPGPLYIYDKGLISEPYYDSFGQFNLVTREGDVVIPRIKQEEPLQVQSRSFIEALRTRRLSLSDSGFGLGIVRALCAVNESIKKLGTPVSIDN